MFPEYKIIEFFQFVTISAKFLIKLLIKKPYRTAIAPRNANKQDEELTYECFRQGDT